MTEIGILIDSIKRSYERIKSDPGSRIEMDLMMEKTRKLYDLLYALDTPGKIIPGEEEKSIPLADPPENLMTGIKADKKEPVAPRQQDEAVQKNGTTLSDKYMGTQDKTIAARIKMNPINDLKEAIGINDKFVFIKELFNNNILEYNEAIDKLNACTSKDDADKYYLSLKEKYIWDEEMIHVLKLMEFIERRYI